mmetsp:Transcript_70469/g.229119  ORF Transcript_70469/g.229119 Transcript_70469/m.229119 type:complete len:838 (+) Transcript_70469:224-2737(+)
MRRPVTHCLQESPQWHGGNDRSGMSEAPSSQVPDMDDRKPVGKVQPASVHPRLVLIGFATLCTFMLPCGNIDDAAGRSPQRITHEALPPGHLSEAPTPALRGCCGAPTEFLWVFLDEAKEAVAGKPFRTRVLARDARGRQARPSDCDALRVDLGLSGKARLSTATSPRAWRGSELDLVIENEMAEIVQAEVRIESPDTTADVLLHTSQIRFTSGPAHHFNLDLRPRNQGRQFTRQSGGASSWPVGMKLEVAITAQDRFGNRVALAAAGPSGGLALRSNVQSESMEMHPSNGILQGSSDEGSIVEIAGLRAGIVELWLEPVSLNASAQQFKQDLRKRTVRAVAFSSSSGPAVPPPAPAQGVVGLSVEDARWKSRADEVRDAALHAWTGYRKYAWGRDELQPVTHRGKDTFGGIGMTVVDSMTTLWLMGLGDEFEQAAKFVQDDLDFDKADTEVSVFELVIRGVGGLLGAHALSGRQVFLDRAVELGNRLLPAFNTSSRLPWPKWNIATGKGAAPTGDPTILSEAGSVQLEFRCLTEQTGDLRYKEAGDKAFEAIQSAGMTGLMPVYLTPPDHSQVRVLASKFAFGALADSYYEYLLKQWLQNPADQHFKDLWLNVMDELPGLLRPRPTGSATKGKSSLYRLIEVAPGGEAIWKMDHLSCYAPGMIALGLQEVPDEDLLEKGRNSTLWSVAEGLTESCVQMWTSTKTGLAPEFLNVRSTDPFDFKEVPRTGKHSFLRPETTESLFYLYRLTGDEKYRQWGEQIFRAILKHAKVDGGFSSVEDVNQIPTVKVDELQSFVMAETFKYLFLLFSPVEKLDLGSFVLNTEGHPLLRPPRTKRR